MVRVVAVLAVVVQLASPALAKNPYLPAAKRLWASLDYEEALQELERARQFAGTTPQELVEIEVYTGLLEYELGRVAEADAAFEHALALDPSACLPDEVSPKEKVAFAATKARIASLKLPADRPKAAPASGKTTIDRPVAAAPRPAEPETIVLTPVAAPEPRLAPPVLPAKSSGPFWLLGGAAASGLAGGVFGYLANESAEAARSSDVQTAVAAKNADADQRALLANVLFAVATCAFVAGGAWLANR